MTKEEFKARVSMAYGGRETWEEFLEAVWQLHLEASNQCVPVYTPPCYAPNGICTNPQMDCINCPKRGTGGTWSTSTNTIKVKGKRCELTDEELTKRINEDNKED